MKKFLLAFALWATLAGAFCASCYAAAYVDDSELRLATEVFGEIGATVEYKYPENTLTVSKDGKTAVLTLCSRLLYRDGEYYTLDREVVVWNDRAYVSPDATEKAFGLPPQRTVDPARPMVCLTFDDGPYPPTTERILDTLDMYNSKATFFVLGNMIWQYPQTLKRADDLGMQIGNHSYYHPHLPLCTWDKVIDEINMTNYDARLVIGHNLTMMRPPHGETNDMVREAIGMPIIKWSLDTLDWQNLNSGTIYNTIMDNVTDGDIILMHDTIDCTATAVEWIVPDLLERGFQLVTVEEMIRAKGWTEDPGVEYYAVR